MKMLPILSLILATLIVMPVHLGYAIDDDSIVVYLSFDEGSGDKAQDQSVYGNDADIVENTEWASGKVGGAIEITAQTADAVVIPSSESLKIEGEITMMAWINPVSWGGDNHTQLIDKRCHNGGETNFCYGIDLGGAGGKIGMFVGTGAARPVPTVDAPLELEKWQHVAATYDGEVMKAYLDGEFVGEAAEAGGLKATNEYEVRIGCARDRPQYGFVGSIDEVLIANRAFDENEVNNYMQGAGAVISPRDKLASTWSNIKTKSPNS